MSKRRYVRFFEELTIDDVGLVGGKNASLGEMYRELVPKGVLVPNGFALTADAYRDTLTAAGAWDRLHEILDDIDPDDVEDLARRAAEAREVVYAAPLPAHVERELLGPIGSCDANTATTCRSPCGRRRRLRICPRPASPASRTPTSTFGGSVAWSTRPGDASPASSPTGRSTTGSTKASTTSPSPCRWG